MPAPGIELGAPDVVSAPGASGDLASASGGLLLPAMGQGRCVLPESCWRELVRVR